MKNGIGPIYDLSYRASEAMTNIKIVLGFFLNLKLFKVLTHKKSTVSSKRTYLRLYSPNAQRNTIYLRKYALYFAL